MGHFLYNKQNNTWMLIIYEIFRHSKQISCFRTSMYYSLYTHRTLISAQAHRQADTSVIMMFHYLLI